MKTLLVTEGGLLTTIQDCGRAGIQAFGVPVCGAMDTYSLRWANKLVGNPQTLAGLEMTIKGATLQAMAPLLVAITGADLPITINGFPEPSWQALHLAAGDELAIGSVSRGARAYLAVMGGVDVPVVMGSRSTFLRGHIGGFGGRVLRVGDVLPIGACEDRGLLAGSFVPSELRVPLPASVTTVRVMMGPQDDLFTEAAILELARAEYVVSADSDRMAYRLQGNPLAHRAGPDIVSDGIAPGSIQVPRSGQPIIMLADRQTTGGYAKIATVIGADLPLLGQTKPGDKIKFAVVSYSEALLLLRELTTKLHQPIVPVRGHRTLRVTIDREVFHVRVGELVS